MRKNKGAFIRVQDHCKNGHSTTKKIILHQYLYIDPPLLGHESLDFHQTGALLRVGPQAWKMIKSNILCIFSSNITFYGGGDHFSYCGGFRLLGHRRGRGLVGLGSFSFLGRNSFVITFVSGLFLIIFICVSVSILDFSIDSPTGPAGSSIIRLLSVYLLCRPLSS